MAQINVCDRCRKELTYRRTLVGVKSRGKCVDIKVLSLGDITGSHSFELCDDCANRLGEFLHYGPTEGSTEAKEEPNGEG